MRGMQAFDALSAEHQDVVREMRNEAQTVLGEVCKPLNDDHGARFDEACAVYFKACFDAHMSRIHDPRDTYEIVGVGFDGGSDKTDDRVIHVRSTQRDLDEALAGIPIKSLCRVQIADPPIDYFLPYGAVEMRERLKAYATETAP